MDRFDDICNEAAIDIARWKFAHAETWEERRGLADHLMKLINNRSPEKVAEMEHERGLI